MNEIDAAIAALLSAEISAAAPVAKTRTVVTKHVIRDPVTKKLIGVNEVTEHVADNGQRIMWKGIPYAMPKVTSLISKTAKPKSEPPPMTAEDEDDVWLRPDLRESHVRLEDLDTSS